MRVETFGDATLYLGDCLEVMPQLGAVDAVVTDPPYGLKRDKGFKRYKGHKAKTRQYTGEWDSAAPDKAVFDAIIGIAPQAIVWGGNYFTDRLPQANHWLVWDKGNTMPSFSDVELAWTSIRVNTVKRFFYLQSGFIGQKERRVHPTQKPLEVMRWSLQQLRGAPQTILDPFMGSGTTGVAALSMGRRFIGIELDETYFDTACRRMEEALAQPSLDLMNEPRKRAEQPDLL